MGREGVSVDSMEMEADNVFSDIVEETENDAVKEGVSEAVFWENDSVIFFEGVRDGVGSGVRESEKLCVMLSVGVIVSG